MYKQPVFIVGVPRTGTTLIQSILCNSGHYFPIPETHFFSKAALDLPENDLDNVQKKKLIGILKKKSKIEIGEGELPGLNSKKEIFEFIINRYNQSSRDTFLEKTPRHIFHHKEILRLYPDARFICMIREPRNTVSSILRMRPESNKSATRFAFLYRKTAGLILHISGNKNVFVLRYEDLVDNTRAALHEVCKYLQLPYNSRLTEDVAAPHEIISFHEKWKDRNISFTKVDRNDAERWKKSISDNTGDLIACITGSLASQFGYKITYNWNRVCKGFLRDVRDNLSSKEVQRLFYLSRIK